MSYAATRFGATLRRTWPVLVSYGVFSMWGVGCFVVSLALSAGGFGVAAGAWGAVFGIIAATAAGHVAGNLLGLARLRLAVVVVVFVAALIAATASGALVGALAVFLVVAVLAALGGYLGVASRLDVVASWFPLGFAVGAAMVWLNLHGRAAVFHSGAKYAVWDPFTVICLSGAVFLNLVFLATRHSLGLTVWQEVGRPAAASPSPDEAVAVARPGRGSLLVLLVFSFMVLGATALISPYLFRTARSDDPKADASGKDDSGKGKGDSGNGKGNSGKGNTGKGDSGNGNGKGNSGKGNSGKGDSGKGDSGKGNSGKGDSGKGNSGKGDSGEGDSGKGNSGKGDSGKGDEGKDGASDEPLGHPDAGAAGEAGSEALELGMHLMLYTLAFALALLILLLIAFPPMRRAFLIRHLERPIWPVSPTTRVMNLWRRALAALAVVDIGPAPGEAPRDFARRAAQDLQDSLGCDAPGLAEAAAIVEKVDYAGRGLGPGEERTMRDAVTSLVRAVGAKVGAKKKIAAAWGPAPEVES